MPKSPIWERGNPPPCVDPETKPVARYLHPNRRHGPSHLGRMLSHLQSSMMPAVLYHNRVFYIPRHRQTPKFFPHFFDPRTTHARSPDLPRPAAGPSRKHGSPEPSLLNSLDLPVLSRLFSVHDYLIPWLSADHSMFHSLLRPATLANPLLIKQK